MATPLKAVPPADDNLVDLIVSVMGRNRLALRTRAKAIAGMVEKDVLDRLALAERDRLEALLYPPEENT